MSPDPEQLPADAATVERELARHAVTQELTDLAAAATTQTILELPVELLSRLADSNGPDESPFLSDRTLQSTTALERAAPAIERGFLTRLKRGGLIVGVLVGFACLLAFAELTGLTNLTGLTLLPGPATHPEASSAVTSVNPVTAAEPQLPVRSVWPPRQLADLPEEKHDWQPHEPLSRAALTTAPAAIIGVLSWTCETRQARGRIRAIRRSLDGTRIACGGADGCLQIYSLPDLELQNIFVGHVSIESIRWQTNSTLIAADADGTVRLWNVNRGQVLRTWSNHATPTRDADLSYDGTRVAIAGVGAGCRVGQIDHDNPLQLPATGQAYVAAWSPTGNQLGATNEQTFRLFQMEEIAEELSSRNISPRIMKCGVAR